MKSFLHSTYYISLLLYAISVILQRQRFWRDLRHCASNTRLPCTNQPKWNTCTPSTLKVGATCTYMCNIVKNALLTVEGLHQRYIIIQVLNRTGQLGETQCILCIRFKFTLQHSSWSITRLQFPSRLSYTTTFYGCCDLALHKLPLTFVRRFLLMVNNTQRSRVLATEMTCVYFFL